MNNKIIVSSALAASFMLVAWSSYAAGVVKAGFSDIERHWGKSAILSAAAVGLVDGYEDGTFKPDHTVTRAEFMKLVAAGLKLDAAPTDGNDWYMPYVKALKGAGIMGKDYPLGDVNVPMERSEMAMFSMKAVDNKAMGTMAEAVNKGLIQGVGNGELSPTGVTTRAQAVTIIERILKAKAGEKLEVDKYAVRQLEIEETGSNVKSMLGLTPLNIGKTWSMGEGAYVTLNQLIIADPLDPNDPYIGHVRDKWVRNQNKETDVVVLAKFTVNIDESADDSVDIRANQNLTLNDPSGLLLLEKEGLKRVIPFSMPGTYQGFVAYTMRKEHAKTGIYFDIAGNDAQIAKP